MKLEQIRPNAFTLTLAGRELSAMVAASRLALEVMRADSQAPAGAVALLERMLREYDAAVGRLRDGDGRTGRPSVGSP
jgi:hypothetical protein